MKVTHFISCGFHGSQVGGVSLHSAAHSPPTHFNFVYCDNTCIYCSPFETAEYVFTRGFKRDHV